MDLNWSSILLIFGIMVFILIIIYYLFRYSLSKKKPYISRYPSKYKCNDGHIVRSLSELIIDNYFFQNDVKHEYEDYIKKNSVKKYKYDWFLPETNLYIEFFGYSGRKYIKNRLEKEKFYRFNNLRMISFLPEDLSDLKKNISNKLSKHLKTTLSEKFCPNCGEMLDSRF